jgi:ATP-dependent Clp protease ATP-binding subunit ClpA
MPFINDKIEANKELVDQSKAKGSDQPAFASRFRFDPEKVMTALKSKIVGQDEVLSAIEDMLYLVKADFGEKQRPLAVYFFMGSTGVGKTETVKQLAKALLGEQQKLCRIDMNTLAQEHYAAALTGAPPGYVGSKEGHSLFDVELIGGSFSQPGIVLFDEVEKASPQVIRTLLNIFDNGKLLLTSGQRQIDFSNSIIFLTSNVGSSEVRQARSLYQQGWWHRLGFRFSKGKHIAKLSLENTFDPEFLNRIDRILTFNDIDEQWLDNIIDVFVSELNGRLEKKSVFISVDQTARDQLCRLYDHQYGVRDIHRHFRQCIEPLLAKAILKEKSLGRYLVTYDQKSFSISPQHSLLN